MVARMDRRQARGFRLARLTRVGVLALAAVFSAQTAQAEDAVKVMSFNVRTSYAAEDSAGCRQWNGVRKGNVVAQITTVGPDFVGTQETSAEQKAYLDSSLGATYGSFGQSSGSLGGRADEYTAIYYNKQKWKMLTNGMFWLGPNPDAMTSAWGMKYFRTCSWGRFQHLSSGKTVCVLNTHYEEPGNDEAQKAASDIIMSRASAVCSGDDKFTVVTGDFNAGMAAPAMTKYFEKGWKEESSANTFCGDMTGNGCGTKYDFTLHKLKDGVCLQKDEVIRQSFGGCYPSDHAVLMATFCIDGSCCPTTEPTTATPTETTANATNTNTTQATTTGSQAQAGTSTVSNEAGGLGTVKPSDGEDTTVNTAGTSGPTEINSKSVGASANGSSVMIGIAAIGAVAAIAGFVMKKKRNLEEMLGINKQDVTPQPSFFRASDAAALSPKRASNTKQEEVARFTSGGLSPVSEGSFASRRFSSPIPTLGGDTIFCMDERDRSISDSSSIACIRQSQASSSDRQSSDRMESERVSSPIILDESSGSNHQFRGSSRIYFGGSTLSATHGDFSVI